MIINDMEQGIDREFRDRDHTNIHDVLSSYSDLVSWQIHTTFFPYHMTSQSIQPDLVSWIACVEGQPGRASLGDGGHQGTSTGTCFIAGGVGWDQRHWASCQCASRCGHLLEAVVAGGGTHRCMLTRPGTCPRSHGTSMDKGEREPFSLSCALFVFLASSSHLLGRFGQGICSTCVEVILPILEQADQWHLWFVEEFIQGCLLRASCGPPVPAAADFASTALLRLGYGPLFVRSKLWMVPAEHPVDRAALRHEAGLRAARKRARARLGGGPDEAQADHPVVHGVEHEPEQSTATTGVLGGGGEARVEEGELQGDAVGCCWDGDVLARKAVRCAHRGHQSKRRFLADVAKQWGPQAQSFVAAVMAECHGFG